MQKVKIRFAYRQGFRRIWAVMSAIWIVFALNLTINQIADSKIPDILMFSLLPPIVIYLISVAFVWIIEGFARADR